MEHQVTYYTVKQLKLIIDNIPCLGLKELTNDIKEGFKYTRLVTQHNLLEKLRKKGDATSDVISIAKKITSKYNSVRNKKEESRMMGLRIAEKSKECRIQRQKWCQKSISVESGMQRQVKEHYRHLKRQELDRVWRLEKARIDNKLSRTKIVIPDIYAGIKIADHVLKGQFGDCVTKPVVLGGIVKTENIEAYINLPLGFRMYGKVDKDSFETEVESVAAKQRWSVRETTENPGESNQERCSRRERENLDREPIRDRESKEVNFSKLRVTQFKSNKMIYMPTPIEAREEIKIESQRFEALDTVRDYLRSNCDDKGVPVGSENLTRKEMLGRQEILRGIKDKGWMLYSTDKSGKMVLDTKANYLRSMEPHFVNEEISDMESVEASEKILNAHSKAWCRMLGAGTNAGGSQAQRINNALKSVKCTVPPLKGLRKDHKKTVDPILGPPNRPFLNAGLGPNASLGNLQARFLRPVKTAINRMVKSEVCSTEEVQRSFEDYNKQEFPPLLTAPADMHPLF